MATRVQRLVSAAKSLNSRRAARRQSQAQKADERMKQAFAQRTSRDNVIALRKANLDPHSSSSAQARQTSEYEPSVSAAPPTTEEE